jgi:hypothetical protein
MNFLRNLLGLTKKAQVKDRKDPASFKTPMIINQTMLDKYGEDWLLYLPETVRICLKDDFNITPDEILANKIFATQFVLRNPYMDWDMFENVINSFNNNTPDFTIIEPPSMPELVWGYICIKSLRQDWEISLEIKEYIKSLMKHWGLIWCPWIPNVEGAFAPDTVTKIKSIWKSPIKFTRNSILGVQIDRLNIIKEYVRTWA